MFFEAKWPRSSCLALHRLVKPVGGKNGYPPVSSNMASWPIPEGNGHLELFKLENHAEIIDLH